MAGESPAPPRTIAEIRSATELRNVCQDDAYPIYIKIYRLPSIYLTRLFLVAGVSANQITLTGVLIGVLACCMISFGDLISGLVGYTLLQLHLVLDCSDGEVARFTKSTSGRGQLLDYIGHSVVYPSIFLAMGWAAMNNGASPIVLVLAGMSASLYLAAWLAEQNSILILKSEDRETNSDFRTLRSSVRDNPTRYPVILLAENLGILNSIIFAIALEWHSLWVSVFTALMIVSSVQRFASSASQIN